MNKIKKFFMGISIFFTSIVSKVYAIGSTQILYGVIDPGMSTLYGVFEPTIGEKISRVGKIALPIILFIIGLFVILSKKITKKIKFIVISSLVLAGIIGMFVMNYLANNF